MELISREDLLYGLSHFLLQESPIDDTDIEKIKVADAIKECMRAIEEAPTIESRSKGKWIDAEIELETLDGVKTRIITFECSECGTETWHTMNGWKFCPNCGAEMEVE